MEKVIIPSGPHEALNASKLQDEFVPVWTAAGAPPEAAMYGGMGVRQQNDYYFTPAAVALVLAGLLLVQYGAVDCEEPDVTKLATLVKNSDAAVRQ